MKLSYLPSGQQCWVIGKIGDKYAVNRVFEHYTEENGWVEIEDPQVELVNEVFDTKPVPKIESEISELNDKKNQIQNDIQDLMRTKSSLEREVESITRTQLSKNKFIVNRSELMNAKRVVLFPDDRVMPITLEDDRIKRLKISLVLTVATGEENACGYEVYENYDRSHHLDKNYGILIDPTEEEVAAVIRKRLQEREFADWAMKSVDDKYLSEELKTRKYNILEDERSKRKAALISAIEKATEQLAELEK